ncbi:hypothetical protein ACFX1S_014659 [Malus domestica]
MNDLLSIRFDNYMIESVLDTSRQRCANRNDFGRSSALTEYSTGAARSLEYPSKVSPHPAHSCTTGILTPCSIRIDLDGPELGSLPVRGSPGSSWVKAFCLDLNVPIHSICRLPKFIDVLPP